MSLTKPSVKMSKSDPNLSSRILLNDSPTSIREKIHGALTDSLPGITFDPSGRPGLSNLVRIEAATRDHSQASVQKLVEEYTSKGTPISELKANVAKAIIDRICPAGERYESLISDERRGYLAEMADLGARKASAKATRTMSELRAHVGMSRLGQ